VIYVQTEHQFTTC